MIEACPTCDTLWRLYAKAADNLHELVGKFRDSRDKGDANTADILSHELAIAESSLRSVRRELLRHERSRHNGQNGKRKEEADRKQGGNGQERREG